MIDLEQLHSKAEHLILHCRQNKIKISTAESCTGGLLSAVLTGIPGSSQVFERGAVTYSNEAKHEMLGVPTDLIEAHGAVSEQVAHAMAEGALLRSRANIAISITGIAGPDGGTSQKPVGLVHFCVASTQSGFSSDHKIFTSEGRNSIRSDATENALDLLIQATATADSLAPNT
ncbi:CinA family protein [Flexibacterium corallicola]|uniref:CinA family protein n=1 Tax=Flexibacterium corallicola TaxID=3037259 RepID=UPI00286F6CDF|nr:CinA family protein [Pseudovibrio sp. M1P-2-3]